MKITFMKWIVEDKYRSLAADRYGAHYKGSVVRPVEAVVIHYTASRSVRGTKRWLTDEDDTFLSVHFLIARNGTVTQMIPLHERGAHAGGRTSKLFGKGNVNGRTVGIELMNVGPLRSVEPDSLTLETWGGRPFEGAPIMCDTESAKKKYPSRYWEAYSTRQVEALIQVGQKLIAQFPILKDVRTRFVGHEDVDPTRKNDPGPAFPWNTLYEGLTS